MKKLLLIVLKLTLLTSLLYSDTLDECVEKYKIEELQKAEIICNKALEENPKSYETNFTLVLLYSTTKNYKKALEYAKKMEQYSVSHEDFISSYEQIGLLYGYLKDKKQELIYLEKSLEISKASENNNNIGKSLHNIGNYYYNNSNFLEAEKYYKKALEYKTDKLSIANTYNSLSVLNVSTNNDKSIDYQKKALSLVKEADNPLYYANYSLFLSKIYIDNQEYDLAKPLLFEAFQIAQNNQMIMIQNFVLKYLTTMLKSKPMV